MEERRLVDKRGVLTGLIVWVIAYFLLEPIAKGAWLFMKTTRASLSDTLYRTAALGSAGSASVGLYALVMPTILSIAAVVLKQKYEYSPSRNRNRNFLVMFFPVLALILVCFYNAALSFGVVQINTSLRQRLLVLAPYLSDEEEEKWMARWVQMSSGLDYEQINSDLNSTAQKYGVSLPPPLWK